MPLRKVWRFERFEMGEEGGEGYRERKAPPWSRLPPCGCGVLSCPAGGGEAAEGFSCKQRGRDTHNIARLIERCREIDPEFERLYDMEADRLTEYAVEARYPEFEEEPSTEEAEEAVKIA